MIVMAGAFRPSGLRSIYSSVVTPPMNVAKNVDYNQSVKIGISSTTTFGLI